MWNFILIMKNTIFLKYQNRYIYNRVNIKSKPNYLEFNNIINNYTFQFINYSQFLYFLNNMGVKYLENFDINILEFISHNMNVFNQQNTNSTCSAFVSLRNLRGWIIINSISIIYNKQGKVSIYGEH